MEYKWWHINIIFTFFVTRSIILQFQHVYRHTINRINKTSQLEKRQLETLKLNSLIEYLQNHSINSQITIYLPIRFAYYFLLVRYEQLKNLSLLNCHIEKEEEKKNLAKSITNHWNKRKSACKVTRQCDISSSNVSKRVSNVRYVSMMNPQCQIRNMKLAR